MTTPTVVTTWIHQRPEGRYATEPSLALDHDGQAWLAWTERAPHTEGGRESIVVARLGAPDTMERWGAVEATCASSEGSIATWPVLTAGSDHLRLTWIELSSTRAEGARLITRDLTGEGQPHELDRADSIRDVTAMAAAGATWIAFARSHGDAHTIDVIRLSDDPGAAPLHVSLDRSTDALRQRPTIAPQPDGGAQVLWESYASGAIQLRGASIDQGGEVVERGPWGEPGSFNQSPALALRGGEPWVAWTSDHRPDHPDLARRVRLARWSQRQLKAPESDPPGVDLEAKGEDQSLEFPAAAGMPGGGIWIVARASHNYRLLTFHGDRWGEPLELGDVLWGCRGTRIEVTPLGEGDALITCHDRRGLTVRRVQAQDHWSAPPEPLEAIPDARVTATHPPGARPEWDSPGGRLGAFWGDIHFHSAHSDGVGTVSEAYVRCRDRYGYDFACLTDHDGFIGRRVTDAVWRRMVDVAEHFDRPAEGFATLIGVEYTGLRYPGPGHKCLYFDGPDAPLVCRRDGLEPPEALLARVRELGGIAIPHHVGWLGGDPEHHDPEVQPCWEMCSTHGQYEAEVSEPDAPPIGYREGLEEHREALRGHFMRRQLEAGRVFGFVGGSDGHGLLWHHGISRKRDSHRTGLTGVWLPELSRAAIMAAIRARRTWGTSGARMALAFLIDGAAMGSVIAAAPPATSRVEIVCDAGAPLRELAVLGSTSEGVRVLHRVEEAEGALRWRGAVPIPGVEGPGRCVYVRAVREDDEVAWASPVFWRP